jgi:hypothetical protein
VGVVYEDLYDHEGHAAGTPAADARRGTNGRSAVSRFVACCSCGWTGTCEYPLTEEGRERAIGEWEDNHALPLLELAIPASVGAAVEAAEVALQDLVTRRPRAARLLLERHARWLHTVEAAIEASERELPLPPAFQRTRGLGR